MVLGNLKYNYIIFASLDVRYNEFLQIMYNDLQGYDNVTFINTPFANRSFTSLFKILHKIHFHGTLNKFCNLPLKSIWNRYYFNENIQKPQCYCFVFFMTELNEGNESFFKYLQKHYPGSKMVLYFDDIIASRNLMGKSLLRLDFIAKYFDLTLSYDLGDCEKYGYLYYPTSYSVVDIAERPEMKSSHLFFCGAAKQRYDIIVKVYEKCIDKGLKCDFTIARYGGCDKIDGITYVPYVLPYKEYLEHMNKTSCLLDVIQEGSRGFTVRVWEALVYGKKLLTNNKNILKASFYNEQQFCYFEEITDKELNFIKERKEIVSRNVEELSPIRLLEFIDHKIR